MRHLLTVLFSLALLSCTSIRSKDNDVVAFVAKNYVNKIYTADGGHCTSFYADVNGKIRHLTAAHCCKQTMFLDSKPLEFVKVDFGSDVCELSIDSSINRGIKLALQPSELTDITHVIGFPIDSELTITSGRTNKTLRRGLFDTLVVRTTSVVLGGNSGGPVVNDNGELVGIVSQTTGFYNGLFVPTDIVLDIIK
jgi:V8-like Glu-specific endopeptidase